jgi:ketosteroid isomerase-like protein
MHPPDRIPDRLAIADLNAAWCARLDANDIPGLIALYAPDAAYVSPTGRCAGTAEIEAYFRARTAKGPRTTRHLQSGLIVNFDGETARGTSVCLSFAQDGAPPLPIEPFLVADFIDRYVRDPQHGWRIAERTIVPVFRRA